MQARTLLVWLQVAANVKKIKIKKGERERTATLLHRRDH
jgi:hypothetical protein